jgi:hypothetical protein
VYRYYVIRLGWAGADKPNFEPMRFCTNHRCLEDIAYTTVTIYNSFMGRIKAGPNKLQKLKDTQVMSASGKQK